MAPPTITPCSLPVVADVLPVVAVLVVVLFMLLESVPLAVDVPESEQEIKAVEKRAAAAKVKIGLRIIVFGFKE